MHARLTAALLVAALGASGCNLFGGGDSAEAATARREADGRAIGGACRHAGRAIEDCFTLNRRADKASVYAGWREMNDYMRENKIEPVSPQLTAETVAQAADAEGRKSAHGDKADRSEKADKAADKPSEGAEKSRTRDGADKPRKKES
ncbi:MAG: hypothetical protein HS128_22975 [Ideonella sp.]|nr:hypothetical protein [Ideonella sp.]MCC7456523.1 hypothetical protein [Nitrospira sp.]